REMVGEAMRLARVRAAGRRFADQRGAFGVLHGVGEVFAGGERVGAREYVYLFAFSITLSGDLRAGPARFDAVAFAPVDVVEVRRAVEQIAREQHDRFRVATVHAP